MVFHCILNMSWVVNKIMNFHYIEIYKIKYIISFEYEYEYENKR